jgi:RND superfamily putative drug exporter
LAPHQIVIETGRPGGAYSPAVRAAEARLVAELRRDPEVKPATILSPSTLPPGPRGRAIARRNHLVDASGQVAQIRVAGHGDAGTTEAQNLVHRIRDTYIPAARFRSAEVVLTGAPAFGVDFKDLAYGAFPWLVVAVLILSYLLLLRAFRSVVLPLKAVLLNLLSVAAAYGMLVVFFRYGLGQDLFGLYQFSQVEGWIPIFLFAMLFGLSMDYEVFLVTRMREAWDEGADNATAVELGLEKTGRIITAAAIIMCAAFSGFVAGSIVGLQEFGLGLAVAIFVDATIVRCLLVPSMMAILDRWNWWLPPVPARLVRVRPSPLETHLKPAVDPSPG